MKRKILGILITTALTGVVPMEADAVPTLQLDIAGGDYNYETESIGTTKDSLLLYALLRPDSSNNLDDTYYISAALTPAVHGPASLGYFRFNGNRVDVTSGMNYGVPPLEANLSSDQDDLQKHGVFPTYFKEFGFQFNSGHRIKSYNSQERAEHGGEIDTDYEPYGSMYFASFEVDRSKLHQAYELHFDLYNSDAKDGDVDVTQFAPFSHDAETVPEPGVLFLMGVGLMGLYLTRMKWHKSRV